MGLSQVNDAYVWAGVPDYNGGGIEVVYTGLFTNAQGSGEKYSLFRFEMRTPTAVQLQSLSARSSVSPELAMAAVGMVGGARGDILMAFNGSSPAAPGQWLYEYEVSLVGGG